MSLTDLISSINVHTLKTDEVVYAYAGNNVSNADTLTVRRELPMRRSGNTMSPQRANLARARDFTVASGENPSKAKAVLSISTTIPVGIDPVAASQWLAAELTALSEAVAHVGITGDIHLKG